VHLRPPALDPDVTALIWALVLALYFWLLMVATGVTQGTAFILAALAALGIFFFVRLCGADAPPRSRRR
jgi:hypothetical protein